MHLDSFTNWVLVAGTVGTAAMGLVEALKSFSVRVGSGPVAIGLGVAGLGAVKRSLGANVKTAIEFVYGAASYGRFLEGAWRKGAAELETALRNGLRMAVFSGKDEALAFVADFGANVAEVKADVETLRKGTSGPDVALARERIARLEAAIDARVQAAVASGRDQYVFAMQVAATVVAIAGCQFLARRTEVPESFQPSIAQAWILGLLAVPIAPVAKDIVTFLNSLRNAFAKRGTAA